MWRLISYSRDYYLMNIMGNPSGKNVLSITLRNWRIGGEKGLNKDETNNSG